MVFDGVANPPPKLDELNQAGWVLKAAMETGNLFEMFTALDYLLNDVGLQQ